MHEMQKTMNLDSFLIETIEKTQRRGIEKKGKGRKWEQREKGETQGNTGIHEETQGNMGNEGWESRVGKQWGTGNSFK